MKALAPIFDLMALAWWRWALHELSHRQPLHPDIPMVLQRVRALEDRTQQATRRNA